MPLTPEDGSGLANADSYITVADADARRASLGGDDAWNALTDGQKEAALRKATEYLEQRYAQSWQGARLNSTQALSWPRYGATAFGYAIDSDVVPSVVSNACADLALKTLTETLNADQTRGIVREKVGPLETEYDRLSPQATQYRSIDAMLAPLLAGGGAMARLVRA